MAWAPRAWGVGILEPAPEPLDTWSESFTFLADADDGSYVWAQLSLTNLGPGSGNGSCRVLVFRPNRPAFIARARAGRPDWRYVAAYAAYPERLDVPLGRCSAQGGEQPRVRATLEGRTVELRFAQPFQPFLPPGAELTLSSGRYRSEVLLPFAAVELSLSGKDWGSHENPTRLGGVGYADHSRSTVTPPKLAARWLRFRALRANPRTLLLGREAPDGSFGPVYAWQEGEAPEKLVRFALARTGTEAATSWRAEVPGAGVLQTLALLHRSAPVQELGALGILVRPIVGSPVTYTYRAVLERSDAAPLAGVMEVSLEED
ncbi:MAG TPA: hypothetical protein VE618_04275 [Myxococcaceae bacterium]|nr:hypothetical protein [Myxococcaceae bacterium]